MDVNPLRDAALDYARRGWAVFPLFEPRAQGRCSCPKAAACARAGKHPRTRRGVLNATVDAAQIGRWWRRWPAANVGLATGAASGLVVLDVDPRNGGDDSLVALEGRHGRLPDGPRALTGGGGVHLFFRRPDDADTLRGVPLAPGVDVKADAAYVVASPSLHRSGRSYVWEIGAAPDDLPLPPLPAWVVVRLTWRVPPYGPATEAVTDGLIGRAFQNAGWLLRIVGAEKAAVRCPWEDRHTVGSRGDGSTVVFAPAPGHHLGWFHCSHEHCRFRRLADVLAVLPEPALDSARAALALPADYGRWRATAR
jgi:hypothetical protein